MKYTLFPTQRCDKDYEYCYVGKKKNRRDAAVAAGAALAAILWTFIPASATPQPPQVDEQEVARRSCISCHSGPGTRYQQSLHAVVGIQCRQCHYQKHGRAGPGPMKDSDCASCHHEEFVQGRESLHSQTAQSTPTGEGAARRDAVVAGYFVQGRLCIACHYNRHEFHLDNVRAEQFCDSCHDRAEHRMPLPTGESQSNVCIKCHVRIAVSPRGRNINTHKFPGRRESSP